MGRGCFGRRTQAAFVLAWLGVAGSGRAQAQGTISGQVADGLGVGVAGVTVTVTGSGTPVQSTTDGSGDFTVNGLVPGSYTATPTRTGLRIVPESQVVTILGGNASLSFVATAPTVAISGRVVDANGSPLEGVTVGLTGGSIASATTDAAGGYRFAGLAVGASATVTATRSDFTFAPDTQAFPNVQADLSAAPFAAVDGIYRRYFAEGAANGFFSTTFALLNAGSTATTAHLRFLKSTGEVVEHQVVVPGSTRVTIDPAAAGVANSDFATVVESTQPLVADRTMRWDASGYGSHAETSLAQPLTTWYFAEGSTTGSFNLFYLLQNPGATPAQVEVRYLRPAPASPIVKTYTVAPASRRTIYVNQEDPALDETDVSAVVTSVNAVPIVAERAMYTNASGQVFAAGHESAGIAAPASQWFLAEGATGPFFHQFILVANPTGAPAALEFRYLLTDGRVITKRHDIAPNSRLTIGVHTEDPVLANASMSTVITSTQGVPVLVERAMWWPANGPEWYEAHDSAGATATGVKWAVADGEAGGPTGAETYLLIANTAIYPGSVAVTLVFEDGSTATHTYALLPSSRFTIAAGQQFPAAAGRRFGAIVESLGAQPAPIVVERAMYASPGGVTWAAGSNLLATRLRGPIESAVLPLPTGVPGVQAPVTTAGILGGAPETPAPLAIPDVIAETGTPVAEISRDADGQAVARTRIEIGFRRTATVAQVNGVLDTIGGSIVNAIAGVPILTVRIPDPGSLEALDGVIARIRALPAVELVNELIYSQAADLPGTQAASGPFADVDHLLASLAPAAWNVRAALDKPQASLPLAIVTDAFGFGTPNQAFNLLGPTSPYSLASATPNEHGYHVLGIMAATFGSVTGVAAEPNRVVGLFPHLMPVSPIEAVALVAPNNTVPDYQNEIIRQVRDTAGHAVVNTSMAYQPVLSVTTIAPDAVSWITKVRTAGRGGQSLESRFVHALAAGNTAQGASLSNAEAGATLLTGLADASGAAIPLLTNTLIVENVLNTGSLPFEPGCRKFTSNTGGNIAAVGTAVQSMIDNGLNAANLDGTSMASPLVAALAEYLWALAPQYTASDVVARLRATARPEVAQSDPGCTTSATASANAIDAYAAVLSADQGLGSPLVRTTLLDVADATGAATPDGRFDEHDVSAFVSEITTRDGQTFDFSRYDLNGDGRTGGTHRARFDLDANAMPAWTTVTQAVEGTAVPYNETSLTDLQILCYYAYSSLFAGDTAVRASLLPACRGVRVDPAIVTVDLGAPMQFTATVEFSADQRVTWTTTGGTITPGGLLTAPSAAGTIRVRATSFADASVFGEAVVTVSPGVFAQASIHSRVRVADPISGVDERRDASTSDNPFPEMPMVLPATGTFNPLNPSHYDVNAIASIPTPPRRFYLPDSGTFSGNARCAASGPGIVDGNGDLVVPRLPSTSAVITGALGFSTTLESHTEIPQLTVALNGTLTRAMGVGDLGSSVDITGSVTIHSVSGGVIQPDVRVALPDYSSPADPGVAAVPVTRTITVVSPGSVTVDLFLIADCGSPFPAFAAGAGLRADLSYAVAH